MPEDKTKEKLNKDYKEFIDGLELLDIYLKSSSTNRSADDIEDKELSLKLSIDDVLTKLTDNDKRLKYYVSISCICLDLREEEEVFNINLTYVVDFKTKPIESNNTIHDIISRYEQNAIFNAWPFIRNDIKNITNKMAIPTPPVPLFKL